MNIRMMIVGTLPTFRSDLARYIQLLGQEYVIIGEVESGEDALRLIPKLRPDLLLTDLELPNQSGLVLTQELAQRWPQIAVIVMGDAIAAEYDQAVLGVGAVGYVSKLDLIHELPPALEAAKQRLLRPKPLDNTNTPASPKA